eukprot:1157817-Pelagomonas_calceolata.AAC.2
MVIVVKHQRQADRFNMARNASCYSEGFHSSCQQLGTAGMHTWGFRVRTSAARNVCNQGSGALTDVRRKQLRDSWVVEELQGPVCETHMHRETLALKHVFNPAAVMCLHRLNA